MKYFKKFAKLLTYCAIGAVLGFLLVFFTSYMKASAVAGDISRNALLLATQDGCINNGTANQFCENMARSYGTKNLIVAPFVKTSSGDMGHLARYFAPTRGNWDPVTQGGNHATCGLIWVQDSRGNSLLNSSGNDYVSHVQRGETITVTATVEVNMHLNFVMISTDAGSAALRFTVPVSAEATGISSKWFKGET